MEQDYSNYDVLDKLIANTKKARTWTIVWIGALCISAGIIIWMAYRLSEKEKLIVTQSQSIEDKNQLIDSLMAHCKNEKAEIINQLDFALNKTETLVSKIDTRTTGLRLDSQQNNLTAVNTSIDKLRADLSKIKTDIKKEKLRIFIQYNNRDDLPQIKELSNQLRQNDDYFVAPGGEFIDKKFGTIIKCFNYKNPETENSIKELLSSQFKLNPQDIRVYYFTNAKIKETIEIWVGTE